MADPQALLAESVTTGTMAVVTDEFLERLLRKAINHISGSHRLDCPACDEYDGDEDGAACDCGANDLENDLRVAHTCIRARIKPEPSHA